ncbi:MAG: bifunctional folylpolyglutamate synthase/dihydrofolate synthase [Alphaproteobacteria bacterium]|nr:bifunctional folylpolyglutamate synthase/dihydrofolate synthase [Alphaproteobacteria bacterium]
MYLSDLTHPNVSLEEKLNTLFSLNRGRRLEIGFRPAYINLLKKLGNPHYALPPVIHVAGTNGKGSVIATLRAILEAANYRVHTYTSPHLVKFNERIVLAGTEISDSALNALIDETLAHHDPDEDISFFEITTALAFTAFARTPADICLIEVGLGGRLDCTNVIENPLLSIITAIGLDHTEFLGETLTEIAAEKAGIMKPHAPCIIGPQNKKAQSEGVIDAFEKRAHELQIPILKYETDWIVNQEGNGFFFKYGPVHMHLPAPILPGPHQVENTGTALAALMNIRARFPFTQSHIETGLQNVRWPARLQRLTPRSFKLDDNCELWLDGGHNAEAAEALAAVASHWRTLGPKPLHLICAMMAHKAPRRFIEPLRPYIDTLHLIDLKNEPAALKAADIAASLQDLDLEIHTHPDLQTALSRNAPLFTRPCRILICGSLYLAGHVLKQCPDQVHNKPL